MRTLQPDHLRPPGHTADTPPPPKVTCQTPPNSPPKATYQSPPQMPPPSPPTPPQKATCQSTPNAPPPKRRHAKPPPNPPPPRVSTDGGGWVGRIRSGCSRPPPSPVSTTSSCNGAAPGHQKKGSLSSRHQWTEELPTAPGPAPAIMRPTLGGWVMRVVGPPAHGAREHRPV